jgi:hypothetical protein
MKNYNVSLGKWIGVPLWLHWSWWLWMIVILFSNPQVVPVLFSLFFIVVLHEYGHVFAAKCLGVETQDVTLYPLRRKTPPSLDA